MNVRKVVVLALIASLWLVMGSSAQRTPKITLSVAEVVTPGHVIVQGTGFTPKHNISSHMRRPDGPEYPVLPLYTNDKGEFTHDIETLVLTLGVHELWVIDDATKTSSNLAKFKVTN